MAILPVRILRATYDPEFPESHTPLLSHPVSGSDDFRDRLCSGYSKEVAIIYAHNYAYTIDDSLFASTTSDIYYTIRDTSSLRVNSEGSKVHWKRYCYSITPMLAICERPACIASVPTALKGINDTVRLASKR